MTTKVVLLNGPPGCGKDTVGAMLDRQMFPDVVLRSFKTPLYKIVSAVYGIEEEDFYRMASYRGLKELPSPTLGGLSPRQAMIRASEGVIKPNYGQNYFGVLAAKALVDHKINVFTDSGFVEEVPPIIDSVGKENVLLIKIEGRGSFGGDSRGFLPTEMFGTSYTIGNTGSLKFLLDTTERLVWDWAYNKGDINA